MSKGRKILSGSLVFCLFTLMGQTSVYGQLQLLPVDHSKKAQYTTLPKARTTEQTLTLPFWDDFSSEGIDTSKWENQGVLHSYTVAIDPPTYGAALFDGIDLQGRPYSDVIREQGQGDRLTSLPIDLSNLSDAQKNSLYLSFFWQPGGKAEYPDINDRLELYFLNTNNSWDKIWEVRGGTPIDPIEFSQEIMPVDNEAYFHEGFRFRFVSVGRISGPFDSWLIDYVLLNSGRNDQNLFYEDRALTQVNGALFGKYASVPYFLLEKKAALASGSLSNQFNNLTNRFRAMEYTFQIKDRETGSIVKTLNQNTPFSPVPLALERRNFQSEPIEDLQLSAEGPLDLELMAYLTSGDNFLVGSISTPDTVFLETVDFRVNDTVRNVIQIRDFLAYDNGSVDYAAGINQRQGILAVRFALDTVAYLNGISINFTNQAQRGRSVALAVWNNLDSPPIYEEEVGIPAKDVLEDFVFFPLDTTLRVSGEFYVGFTQFTNNFIYVGLDKTNDTAEEIFYNIVGVWQQNEEVRGSLMIRSHLTNTPPEEPDEDEIERDIRIYPNPVSERVLVEGTFTDLEVYDAYGRKIIIQPEDHESGKILNFVGQQKGVYVIRLLQDQKPKSFRILVR
ncbi:T9SS type A sorting domain-containing protein [Pararhodonellum marinum]|uniref:T9SS type A sorting domain-containing protein n=1 Tax=Pararhodonellum marinum TaxID=2755358 RepID=UPI00188FE207|nr:T9SS type A sorting domain-containing protein [Pararhodonellum marinum]